MTLSFLLESYVLRILSPFLLFLSTNSCIAQPNNSTSIIENDCIVIRNSLQLDNCIHKKMLSSNARLLAEIKNFEKRAKKLYTPDPVIGKELIDKVGNAQDAWLNFREKNCIVEAFEVEKGTPAYITTVNNCVIRMNTARINMLKKLLE